MRPDKEDAQKYNDFVERIKKMLQIMEFRADIPSSGIFNIGYEYDGETTETQLDRHLDDTAEEFAKLIADDFKEAFEDKHIDFDNAEITYIDYEGELEEELN